MLALYHTDNPLGDQTRYPAPRHVFHVEDFGENDLGSVQIRGATGSYKFKCEDREVIWCQKPSSPTVKNTDSGCLHLMAFVGIFDGHGGSLASEYCSKGLLPHIMLETEKAGVTGDLDHPTPRRPSLARVLHSRKDSDPTHIKKAVNGLPPLEAAYVKAFHTAQEHFSLGEEPLGLPPSLSPLKKRGSLRKSLRNLLAKQHEEYVTGGTTACTLSVYSSQDAKEPGVYAVVANCGDSRLICDGGSGGSEFHQVTRDHRPFDPQEWLRLQKCVEDGEAFVSLQKHQRVARIFPGGLAVSRTIGDVNQSKGVIPTPDVVRWRLDRDDTTSSTTYRFVVATDGLWDVTQNEAVGALAAQHDSDGIPVSPGTAVNKVMEYCLAHGGYLDDVTIMIIDVTVAVPTV